VVHQLTSLPADPDPKTMQASLDLTSRLRRETVPVFTEAARDAGARRIVVQSISFVTRPAGPVALDEDAPLYTDAPGGFGEAVAAVRDMEAAATRTEGIEGVVLRYGFFYGPGTWNAPDGAIGRMIARRRLPVIGSGEGMYSYIHVDDAADATIAALDRGAPGIYNVCDDEPAMTREWLPFVARAIGAKKPFRVPVWLARRLAGDAVTYYATQLSGASNARAREQLGIAPRPWREGLPAALAA
jgi:nucleoside-diphosphate-sugar epimerase